MTMFVFLNKIFFRFLSQSPQVNINQSQAYALSGNQLGYVYKRNFTFDGTFPVGTDGSDVRAIACAINTFGQDSIF